MVRPIQELHALVWAALYFTTTAGCVVLSFRVEVDGVETLNRSFNRIEEFISDFRSVWPAVTEEFYKIQFEQFDSEGSRGQSGKWTPLSPAYAKYKTKAFPGQPILQATGALFGSITDPDALDAIFLPEKNQLTIGTKVPYAAAHQRGSRRGLPARPVISMNESSKRRIQKAIQRELVAFTRRSGFQVDEKVAA